MLMLKRYKMHSSHLRVTLGDCSDFDTFIWYLSSGKTWIICAGNLVSCCLSVHQSKDWYWVHSERSLTGLIQWSRQLLNSKSTPMDNYNHGSQTCMSLNCGRNPDHPENHVAMRLQRVWLTEGHLWRARRYKIFHCKCYSANLYVDQYTTHF